MSEAAQISAFLREGIETGHFPSAVYLVAEKGEAVFSGALGSAVVEPVNIDAVFDTVYDLASLTKVLVTGLLWAKLLESDGGHLDAPVSKYFEEFKTPDKEQITVRHLLTHSSGMAAWKPLYLLAHNPITEYAANRKEVIKLIAAEPLINAIETKIVYSDLNFILLGFLLEEIYGERLDKIAAENIFRSLDLGKTFFNPIPPEPKENIAASEHGNNYEKQTCIENGYDVVGHRWREEIIWGEVHDGNAYFLNGHAGHAGLFSNAAEVLKIARQFLPEHTRLLKAETCAMFRTNFTPGMNEARSLSFELAATEGSTGAYLSKDSFGHLGFTGTSLWIEPESGRVFILLTNRTHARELPFANINAVRREFHRLAINALEKS